MHGELIERSEFVRLLTEPFLLLDVRSEGEFEQSCIPESHNIPLLTNEERKVVGTTYKQEGQERAIELGHNLVSGEIKVRRVERWKSELSSSSTRALFCARGGLRSKITQDWLNEVGVTVPRVQGGYKALRNYLLELNETLPEQFAFTIIGGSTGVGKTKLLSRINSDVPTIDLEQLARHRGSAFGDVYGGQPPQATFENSLAIKLLQLSKACAKEIFVESESRRIGRNLLPEPFWKNMSQGRVIVLELPLTDRVENILEDYVRFVIRQFHGDLERFGDYLISSVRRIEKHLGTELTGLVIGQMRSALIEQEKSGELVGHREWISTILSKYYDPHYEKHLKHNQNRVILRAHPDEVSSYLKNYRPTV